MDTAEEIDSVVVKLVQMLESRPRGIHIRSAPQYFEEEFREQLPGDWEAKVSGDPRLRIVINPIDALLYKADPQPQNRDPRRVPTLELPRDEFEVIVNSVINVKQFYGVVREEELLDLTAKMGAYYTKESNLAHQRLPENAEPIVGNLYAVFENYWCRVQCLSKATISEAAKFRFVDHGRTEQIPRDRLLHLALEFHSFPFFSCNFHFDEFADIDESDANDRIIIAEMERLMLSKRVRVTPKAGCNLQSKSIPVTVHCIADDKGRKQHQKVGFSS